MSNWQSSPIPSKTIVVRNEKTKPTKNQLVQYTEWVTPTTESPYIEISLNDTVPYLPDAV